MLVHSGARILPEVSQSLSEYALGKLRSRGVEVLLNTRVLGCYGSGVQLSSGDEIAGHTFIWAAGTAPSPVLNLLDVPRAKNGRVEVDGTMAVTGRPGVWAVGDSAAIPDLVTGGLCPPTAQHAFRQGRRLADNVAAAIRGEPPQPFRFKTIGLLAGLGQRCAVAEILGLRFSGFFAWWLWRTIYLMKLPGFERKLRVAIDWTLDLFFPRDIVPFARRLRVDWQQRARRQASLPAGDRRALRPRRNVHLRDRNSIKNDARYSGNGRNRAECRERRKRKNPGKRLFSRVS